MVRTGNGSPISVSQSNLCTSQFHKLFTVDRIVFIYVMFYICNFVETGPYYQSSLINCDVVESQLDALDFTLAGLRKTTCR